MEQNIELIHSKAQEVSDLMKIMSHSDRMVVLCLLSGGEMAVSELRGHTKLSQSAFSQHLAVLRKHELVSIKKSSQQVFYSLADGRVSIILNALQQAFCPPLTLEQ